jgi:hypothetical protein
VQLPVAKTSYLKGGLLVDVQTFREKLMLTILSGLMLRHKEPGYSDLCAIHEAHGLTETWCKEVAAQTAALAEAQPSTAPNTVSLPLCRSCIKLHACIQASDVTQACDGYQPYAAQQQAGA